MRDNDLKWTTVKPPAELIDYVDSFWMLENAANQGYQLVVLPDGRVDIIFSLIDRTNFQVTIKGIDTEPDHTSIPANTVFYAVSFKLLGIEYLLGEKVNLIINRGSSLPKGFWEITPDDLNDFELFCKKVSGKMLTLIKPIIDERKRDLFELIYRLNGSVTVKDLTKKVFWESRQVNRYFNDQFGISLKAYCNILRFRSSLAHIKNGSLNPQLSYADQNHFIREVKRMTGVTPKELYKNENDRFILLSAM